MFGNLFLMMIMFAFITIPVRAAAPSTDLSTEEIRTLEATGKLPGMILTSKEEIKLNDTYEAVVETYEEPEKSAKDSGLFSLSPNRDRGCFIVES